MGTYDFSWASFDNYPNLHSRGGLGILVYGSGDPNPLVVRQAVLWTLSGVSQFSGNKGSGQFADAGLGFRAWGFSSRVELNPGLLRGAAATRSAGWADPLIGARYHRELGNGFGLTAYGDVGGFGVGAHTDWQLLGTVDYTLSPSWNLHLGYRSLNFNITGSEGRFGFNVHMRGPILAGTFRF